MEARGLQLNELGLIKTTTKTDQGSLLKHLSFNSRNVGHRDCLNYFDKTFVVKLGYEFENADGGRLASTLLLEQSLHTRPASPRHL